MRNSRDAANAPKMMRSCSSSARSLIWRYCGHERRWSCSRRNCRCGPIDAVERGGASVGGATLLLVAATRCSGSKKHSNNDSAGSNTVLGVSKCRDRHRATRSVALVFSEKMKRNLRWSLEPFLLLRHRRGWLFSHLNESHPTPCRQPHHWITCHLAHLDLRLDCLSLLF